MLAQGLTQWLMVRNSEGSRFRRTNQETWLGGGPEQIVMKNHSYWKLVTKMNGGVVTECFSM